MGFALMGAMPSMIMRCLGGPLCSLNLPALGRGILLAVCHHWRIPFTFAEVNFFQIEDVKAYLLSQPCHYVGCPIVSLVVPKGI